MHKTNEVGMSRMTPKEWVDTFDERSTEDRREVDLNGYMLVRDNPLTKEGVFPYRGREIGAPDPDRIYYVYRPASELTRPETLESFNLLPLTDDHEMLGRGATPAEQKVPQGYTGESAVFDGTYLRNTIRVVSTRLQELIARGKVELSPGYRCKYIFNRGVWAGKSYDAVQTDIRGNHLALVDRGRTGPDVAILDAYPLGLAEGGNNEDLRMTKEQIKKLKAAGYSDAQIKALTKALDTKDAADDADADAGSEAPASAEPEKSEAEAGEAKADGETDADADESSSKRVSIAEEVLAKIQALFEEMKEASASAPAPSVAAADSESVT